MFSTPTIPKTSTTLTSDLFEFDVLKPNIKISIVIAGYNEEKNIKSNFPNLIRYLKHKHYDYELIFVDDGSSDQSALLFQNLAKDNLRLRLIAFPRNRGKGSAIKTGVLQTTGDYICYTDADMPYDFNLFPVFFKSLKHYDTVIGNRANKHSRYIVNSNVLSTVFIRYALSRIYNFVTRNLLKISGVDDIQCGFKCFNRTVAQQIFPMLRTTGFCFDAELLAKCLCQGFSICQLPVTVNYTTNRTSLSLVKHPFMVLSELLKIRFRARSK